MGTENNPWDRHWIYCSIPLRKPVFDKEIIHKAIVVPLLECKIEVGIISFWGGGQSVIPKKREM